MQKIISILLAITGFLQVAAQDSIKLSLEKIKQLAVENNIDVLNTDLDRQKTNFQLKEAKSKLFPHVEAYSDFSYYYSIPKMILPGEIFGQTGLIPVEIGTKYDWASGFKATQLIYSQSYFTSLKLAKSMISLSKLSLQQKKEEVVYQVSRVYFLCIATQKQIEELYISMQNTNRLLEIAKLQNENGIIRKVDYSRIIVNKNNLQSQIDNLNQLQQQQLSLLKYIIGIKLQDKIILTDTLSLSPVVQLQNNPDFNNRAELKMVEQQMVSVTLTRKMNRQYYLPTLSGFGQYYFQGQRNEFDYFKGGNDKFFKVGLVGLSLNIPIFNGLEKHAKTQQYDIELLKLQNTKKSTVEFFSKEYFDAKLQYENSLNVVIRQEENIKVANETYEVTLQGYQQQVIPLSDLLMSENSLTEARLSYYNALLQLNNSILDLTRARGELLNYSEN